jgi:hypothetical protein
MTLFLHARMANIALALVHLTICPAGLEPSDSKWSSCSRSAIGLALEGTSKKMLTLEIKGRLFADWHSR